MTNEERGTTALTIPALPSSGEMIEVTIRPAARDHLLAWDASQRLVAIHEAGHCCGAAAAAIPVRAVDVTNRHGGLTQLGGYLEDTAIPWETAGRMLDSIVAMLSGSAAERVLLGEHTNGGEADNDRAVTMAMRYILAGFGGPGMFIGQDGLPHGYLTSEIRTRALVRIQEIVAECQDKADALMTTHQDALIVVASAIYEHRRLADERLDAVLRSAGFALPGRN